MGVWLEYIPGWSKMRIILGRILDFICTYDDMEYPNLDIVSLPSHLSKPVTSQGNWKSYG